MDFDTWWKQFSEDERASMTETQIAQVAWIAARNGYRKTSMLWRDWLVFTAILFAFAIAFHVRFEASVCSPRNGTNISVWWDDQQIFQLRK